MKRRLVVFAAAAPAAAGPPRAQAREDLVEAGETGHVQPSRLPEHVRSSGS